ncbi:MGH1-like glycoside hydrolase domain-containing protein [Sunxiuqinia sp. A32]|uniref:MGH1-like glycoside hydrolase domain-containing protein n=1 Tax=Sunxiuqinia sp. A32 TaxID=3461496 RepID=UPI0040455AD6
MFRIIFIVQVLLLGSISFITGCKKNSEKETVQNISGNILGWNDFSNYINQFNEEDEELYVQYVPNDQAGIFLKENIPYFQCPDKELEKSYYFRWWTFRKHIKNTPAGFVITEFLPDVPWAGKYNTICCPAGHHFYEGRWLHNSTFLHDYANFWFKGGGSPRSYSFWAANSILAFTSIIQNNELVIDLLPYLVENYEEWEKSNLCEDGLFWQVDNRDGMEVSVGGSGKRATINSYMIGDAKAIAQIAKAAGNTELMNTYNEKAEKLTKLLLATLWDSKDEFFKTMPLKSEELEKLKENQYLGTFTKYAGDTMKLVDVRELHGYTPWYFNIPENKHSVAWKFLFASSGFKAPYGPTTTEQSHPGFEVIYEGHECQWNGPSWPFATSITLKALANLLRNYNQSIISKSDFVQLLQTYSNSHRRINEKGKKVCWIDENINPFTGDWISRTMLKARGYEYKERGKDYNHSAFCDFVISDLVGIRPSMDDTLTIYPLVPADYWDWFCLDQVKYHDKIISIIWDRDGTKYHKGEGFSVFVDGELKKNLPTIGKLKIQI